VLLVVVAALLSVVILRGSDSGDGSSEEVQSGVGPSQAQTEGLQLEVELVPDESSSPTPASGAPQPGDSYDNPVGAGETFDAKDWTEIRVGRPRVISAAEFDRIGSSEEVGPDEILIGLPIGATYAGDTSEDLYDLLGQCDPSGIAAEDGSIYQFVQASDREGAWNPPPVDDRMPDVRSGFSQEGIALYILPRDSSGLRLVLSRETCDDVNLSGELGSIE
jgi:hypothetical protein